MKIGILTWFCGANYGANLHSYALMRVIQDMGHTCELIQYYPSHIVARNFRMNINNPNWKMHPLKTMRSASRLLQFKRFRKNFILSPRVRNGEEIDHLGYDVVVLGSDEIFNALHPLFRPIYFGVGIHNTRKLLYAPSSGQLNPETSLNVDIQESLAQIRYLSARDRHTKELLRFNTQKEAEIVLDPTFLYSFQHDFQGERGKKNNGKYMLIYSFGDLAEHKEPLKEYAAEHACSIFSVGRYCPWADQSYDGAGVYEWLDLLQNAALVVTDSFHGTIFALKEKREFVLIGRQDKTNKILDLMEMLEIPRGFFPENTKVSDYIARSPLDYAEIDKKLEKEKEKSLSFLESAIQSR